MQPIGVVVIGRNEGNRLHQCLLSVISENVIVVYVDSGSTDGSVALANQLNVHVIELDLAIPFTAARARNAGFEYLVKLVPNLEYVQFVDGDCQIVENWLESAINTLTAYPDVAVVCGRRREQFPTNSIYNRLCDMEWNTPVGETKACGGDALMRISAIKAVGGFNPMLIAGEEPELCLRLRQAENRILRIDSEMTLHDAQITNFGQWWKRSLRAGYAYAQGSWMHGNTLERYWVKDSRSIWFWGLGLPLLAVATFWLTSGLSILLLAVAYIWLGLKIYKYYLGCKLSSEDAALYSLYCVLSKFPQVQGQIQFHLLRLLKRQSNLVEYKIKGVGSGEWGVGR
jgi:glycosyltransferase involved in cell wall biosynthesis